MRINGVDVIEIVKNPGNFPVEVVCMAIMAIREMSKDDIEELPQYQRNSSKPSNMGFSTS